MIFLKNLLILLALFISSAPLSSSYAYDVLTVDEIVDKMDKLYRSKTSRGQIEMMIASENWERTLTMDIWSEGLDMTFIRIKSPKKDTDIATLRMKNEMWNYFPKINKVMKVPPSMMMSSWMGSDFTNDDLVKESSMREDYTGRLITSEVADTANYYIELIPKADIPTVWAKIILVVSKGDYLPVRETYYDEKGQKMRIMEFSEPKTFSGRKIPSVLVMKPLNKPGKKTVIKYIDLEFDIKLEPDIFTLRNLQRMK
ncbi:MAG: outer membrane lipoprotein-sorting protein [Nitrospirae bacterium]|nr:outer membrane lipoprotein-sorting protein [Nitrospirota bacterium]